MKTLGEQLDDCVAFSNKPRLMRLLRTPASAVKSKALIKLAQLLGTTVPAAAETFWGGRMQVRLPEPVSCYIFRYGYFEEGLTRAFLEVIKPGMTVLDIGAHFGYFSMLASHLVGAQGSVHSFEPTPQSFEVLRENAQAHPRWATVEAAVYSTSGTLEFTDYGVERSAYNSAFRPRLTEAETKDLVGARLQVRSVAVDDYAEQARLTVDFAKIDAEGSELQVLRGMERTIQRCKPIVAVEVGDLTEDAPVKSSEIVKHLMERGYDAFEYCGGRRVPHTPRAKYSYDNIVFLPRGD